MLNKSHLKKTPTHYKNIQNHTAEEDNVKITHKEIRWKELQTGFICLRIGAIVDCVTEDAEGMNDFSCYHCTLIIPSLLLFSV